MANEIMGINKAEQPEHDELALRKQWMEEADNINTTEELVTFINKLTEFNHDYGTIIRAMAAGMKASFHVIGNSPQGGITGFQAGCLMWEMVKEFGSFGDGPKTMVCYENMLYPQYEDKFKNTITPSTWRYLQEEAKKMLDEDENDGANLEATAHWQSIVDGIVPFGYLVKDNN